MINSGEARFTELDGLRKVTLTKAERCAKATLPYLIEHIYSDKQTEEMDTTYDSIGARGVNHLANKIMLSMFSSITPFFRLEITDAVKRQLFAAMPELDDTKLVELLSQAEVHGIKQLGALALRPMLFEVVKHLIALGNVLLDLTDKPMAIGIRDYCVVRAKSGKAMEIVLREVLAYEELTEEVQTFVKSKG